MTQLMRPFSALRSAQQAPADAYLSYCSLTTAPLAQHHGLKRVSLNNKGSILFTNFINNKLSCAAYSSCAKQSGSVKVTYSNNLIRNSTSFFCKTVTRWAHHTTTDTARLMSCNDLLTLTPFSLRPSSKLWLSTSSRSVVQKQSSPPLDLVEGPHRLARAHLGGIAVTDTHSSHTYDQLLSWSLSLAADLRAALSTRRSRPQQRVGLLLPPSAAFVAALWAVWAAGHVAVPLCPQHPPLQLQYFLRDSSAVAVMCCPALMHLLTEAAPNLQTVFVGDEFSNGVDASLSAELKEHSFGLVPSTSRALIIYTSGTTGDPKGVVMTHGSLRAGVAALTQAWRYVPSDVLLHCLPLHHVHGLVNALLTPLTAGGRVIFSQFKPDLIWSQLLDSFNASLPLAASPDSSSHAVQKPSSHVNVFMAVPTIYAKLLQHYDQHLASSERKRQFVSATCQQNFRLMVSGSAPLPGSVLQRWKAATGIVLLERYGMTETGMVLTAALEGERREGYVGTPFPGVRVRIVDTSSGAVLCEGDEDSTRVMEGSEEKEGELQVKGPTVFKEYWKKPLETKSKFTKDRWFKTGDTAVYSRQQYAILGRSSVDIIKTGGFKVSALAVERALLDHPAVADVAVVGVPDHTWGQRICAVVAWSSASPPSTQDIREWLKPRLPPYQVPAQLLALPALPRNNMGKVNKKLLLKEYF